MATSTSNDDDVISAINITPLVDVVLVLLVIFLITAPVLYSSAIKVKLPTAATGEHEQKQTFSFTVSAAGQIAWDNQSVDWESLAKRLAALDDTAKQQTAFISADKDTPHGTVIRLMDTLRQAGVTHLAMSVEPAASAHP